MIVLTRAWRSEIFSRTASISLQTKIKNKINLRNLCEERVGKWLPLGISGNTKTLEAIGGDKKICSRHPPFANARLWPI